jgi:hypothetical protein
MPDQPSDKFVCNLDACSPAQSSRLGELSTLMRDSLTGTEELTSGYALHFAADPALFSQLAECITLERLCCSFLNFTLEWPHGEDIRLSITGADGVKAFVREEFALVSA